MTDCEVGCHSKASTNFTAIRNVFKWISLLECILLSIGFLSAIVLGLSVPSAVFFVGEVVTLFITNRRDRLSVLLRQGKNHTDYEQETDRNIHVLAHDIEESVVQFTQTHMNSSLTLTAHNHTISEELDLDFHLNTKFEASMHTICFSLLLVSLCQLVTGFLTTFLFDFVCARFCTRVRHTLLDKAQIRHAQNTSLLDDIRQVEKGLNNNFGLLVSAFVTLIGCVGLSFYRKWQLALILLPYLILKLNGSTINQLNKPTIIKFKRGYGCITSQLLDTLRAVPTVVAFSQENAEVGRYQLQLNNLTKYVQKIALMSGIVNGMVPTFSHLLNAVMLWYGVRLIIGDLRNGDAAFRPGTLVVIFFSFLRGLSTFIQAVPYYPVVKDSLRATARLGKHLQFCVCQSDRLLIPATKPDKPLPYNQKPSFLSSRNGFLADKTAIGRLVLYTSNSQTYFPVENIQQEFETLKCLYSFWPYILFGCVGSIVLGSTIPATFYIFCEIIGSMANLEDEIVFERTTHMLGAFSILAITTLIATVLQHCMVQVLGYLYSNKLRTKLLMAYFINCNTQTIDNFDLLFQQNVLNVQLAVTSVLGTGVEIISAVFVALPLASSVVWSQALILSYIFPTLFAIYFLQYVTEKKENASESLRNSLLWGFVRAFREMAFATILLYGAYLIIHHGENNKNVLQVNLIMINTALQINQLNAVGLSVKNGWKAARSIERFLFQSKLHLTNQSQASIPTSPLQVTFVDARLGQPLVLHPGHKYEIEVDNKRRFFHSLLSGKYAFERQMVAVNS